MSYSLPAGLGVAIMRAIEEAGYELVPKRQPRQAESKCCMLSLNGEICSLERFHKNEHRSASGYTWKGGQPRQADPSGAASSSTTSEQPVDPAAPQAYCNTTSGRLACCCLPGHDGPHESFGGVQW